MDGTSPTSQPKYWMTRENIVPTADNVITFEVKGEDELIGVDNGNPTSHKDFKSNHRRAFNGLCLAIV